MADFDASETNVDAQTASVMALLGVGDEDEGQAEFASDTPSAASDDGDPAPETPASGDDTTATIEDKGAVEPDASSAIEAPETFSAELKERFKALPADLQQTLAQWESERNRGVSQKLEEAATERKAIAAERAQLQPERQRLAQQLESAISLAQGFDPVLAAGIKMSQADWAKLAQEDPAGFVQKKADFEARLGNLQAAVAERNRLAAANHSEVVQREYQALVDALPDLKDAAKVKAFAAELDSNLRSYGFKPEEIAGVVDHRMVKVIADAMKYRAGEKQRQAAAAKVVKPGVPRVVRPGAGDQNAGNAQRAALLKRASGTTNLHEQADMIARLFDQG